MKLQTALERYQQELTEADERLLKVLLANKAEAAFLSAAELSKRAGVHQASAVRLAQKLGYRGYPELRAALQAEFVAPAERVRNRLKRGIEHKQAYVLVLIGLAYSHRQGTMRVIERVSRGRFRAPREEEYSVFEERR
jgi:DNA-binding MurR/RpiR family transcriptional regulator